MAPTVVRTPEKAINAMALEIITNSPFVLNITNSDEVETECQRTFAIVPIPALCKRFIAYTINPCRSTRSNAKPI